MGGICSSANTPGTPNKYDEPLITLEDFNDDEKQYVD